MDAVGPRGERHVEPAIHEHARALRSSRAARRGGHSIDQREQRGAVERALANLDPIDAAAHRRRHTRRRVSGRSPAVDHQTQDRAPAGAQKLAVPSSGLEAEA